MRQLLLSALCFLFFFSSFAQISPPVKYTFKGQRLTDSTGFITVNAILQDGLKLFPAKTSADDPFASELILDTAGSSLVAISGAATVSGKLDSLHEGDMDYRFYGDSVSFQYPVRIASKADTKVNGEFVWLGKKGDEFPNGTENFTVNFPALHAAATVQDSSTVAPAAVAEKKPMGWTLFIICFIAGVLAVFTPCVFPLIPVTVSFFLKKGKTKGEGVRNAWWYAISIILIYTIPTLILTLIFGDKIIYQLSTHPITNLLFFALFIVFAISFFGAFEIELPSSWANKSDSASQKGGFTGIFFMALTLVIVSFSCTGPIVAGLLSETSGKGVSMGPVYGMLGFGFGLAIPFGLFAFFPSMLKALPRSGGWLNTVKVFFGFIELAFAMKFLSNADLQYHWGLLNRDVYLSIWIVIFILLGLYLLGKLKFSHDSDLPYITVTRLFVAIASFAFATYLVPGLWGAPLKALSGILPPTSTQAFNLDELKYTVGSNTGSATTSNEKIRPVKYVETFHVPYGLTAFFDLEEGMAAAKKLNKPIMLDFTGWSCANCRKMENQVWSQPEVLKRIKEDFVLISLYVDDRTELPASEQLVKPDGTDITTIGDKNLDYEKSAFNLNAQPLYKFLDANGKPLSDIQYGYDPDIQKFVNHLDTVKQRFYGQ